MKDSDPQEMEKQMRHTVLPACSLQRVSSMWHKQGIPSRAQLITLNSGGSGKRPGVSRQLRFMDKVPKMGELHKEKIPGVCKEFFLSTQLSTYQYISVHFCEKTVRTWREYHFRGLSYVVWSLTQAGK